MPEVDPAPRAVSAADLEATLSHFIFDVLGNRGLPNAYHRKTLKEAREFEAEPSMEEASDVFLCVLAWVMHEGGSLADLLNAAGAKMAVNLARTWAQQDDGTHQHVPAADSPVVPRSAMPPTPTPDCPRPRLGDLVRITRTRTRVEVAEGVLVLADSPPEPDRGLEYAVEHARWISGAQMHMPLGDQPFWMRLHPPGSGYADEDSIEVVERRVLIDDYANLVGRDA